jgi:hypothetical protein
MVSVGNFYWDTPLFGNGTTSNPSIRFVNDSNTGLFLVEDDSIGVSANGETRMIVSAENGITVEGNLVVEGNLQTLGNTIRFDSNIYTSEEVNIHNLGLGPALTVRQDGDENMIQVYDDANIVMSVYDGGRSVFGPGDSSQINAFSVSPFDATVGVFGNVQSTTWFVGNVDAPRVVADTLEATTFDITGDITANSISASTLTLTGNMSATNGSFSGDVLIAASDQRLKTDIQVIDNALDTIANVHGYTFSWRTDVQGLPLHGEDIGLLAQEVESTHVGSRLVGKAPFDHDIYGNSTSGNGYLTVRYDKLHALQIQCIHELRARIDALEAALEAKK